MIKSPSLFLLGGGGDISLRDREKKVRPLSMFESVEQSTGMPATSTLRKNQSSEDLLHNGQVHHNWAVPLLS